MKRILAAATITAALLIGGCGSPAATTQIDAVEEMAGSWEAIKGESPEGRFKPEYAPITMNVTDEGAFTGNTGCNEYTGAFAIMDGELNSTPIGVTRTDCEAPDENTDHTMWETEVFYLQTLETITKGTISGDTMRLIGEGTHVEFKKIGD